ncbi:glycosyltransferase family 4 protein [Flavicella sp.]|uniref:glycosyltransferase family 4 protein n=1 Tax=Flavicella sp. TaxID=2957742 RepID=UPI0026336EBB|nr:glycosyltransferase family 4 protein [Flavicella sp.]MDG1805735.1 glycosyltransferase family 4 protein [Flavicella sp.]
MKVLILTYYWPPAGGSGVQRWLKFVKYLQNFGITPVVYTVDNPDFSILDTSLEKEIPQGVEVLKQPIWEPYKLASFLSKNKNSKTNVGFLNSKQSRFAKLSTYIRANFFIPDARMFWVKPSVKFLKEYLKENPVDAIISSGPPHTLHKIGLELKKETGIPWISDFRDPWTDIDYFHQLPLSKNAKKKHFKMEQEVLNTSDAVVVVGETMKENYLKHNKNTVVITNGFDSNVSNSAELLDEKFSITHVGMMNEDRNPTMLWDVLKELCTEDANFKNDVCIQLIGKLDASVINGIEGNSLKENTRIINYLPHDKVAVFQKKSQVLLLAVNEVPSARGIITGKIFEYLVAKRPILAIGPIDGDLAKILTESEAGAIVDFGDSKTLKIKIKELYQAFKKNELHIDPKNIEKYHRKELTKQMADLIKRTVS